MEKYKKMMHFVSQFALPVLTILSQIATSLKYPEYGLLILLISEPFWIYSSWKGYKDAGQIGMFVTTIIMTIVVLIGVINYWIKF